MHALGRLGAASVTKLNVAEGIEPNALGAKVERELECDVALQ